jgi:methanethiol S-methyltransferase
MRCWGATTENAVAALPIRAALKEDAAESGKVEYVKYFILAALWIAFCVLHSALISVTFTNFLKRKLGGSYRFYRLFYNIISIATFFPIAIYTFLIREQPFFVWNGYLLPLKYLLLTVGILLFMSGFRHYSFSQLAGFSQIREGANQRLVSKTGELSSRGILGFVRHPFYAAGFPLIWARDIDITVLIAGIILSAYLIIGTILEERKLMLAYGDAYRDYQQRVSMFFPWNFIKGKLALLLRRK